jgi:hypothetical protein
MIFTFTWIMDKLGYMPKIDMAIGKVVDFPVKKQVKKSVAKKATKVAKKAT